MKYIKNNIWIIYDILEHINIQENIWNEYT